MFDFLQYGFMQRALIAGIITAIIAPLVGIFLVVRRYSLIVDTLAHVSLLGLVLGFITGLPHFLFSTLFTTGSGLLIEKLKDNTKLYQESILALFLSTSLAISLVLISLNPNLNLNIFSLLFGSITTVSAQDLWIICILSIFILALVATSFRKMFLIAFDEEVAIASGIKAKTYNMLYVGLTAITVSLAVRIVGVLLIGALMVIPIMTAMNFKQSFKKTLIISLLISISSVLFGIFSSYHLNWPSGATIVIVALLFFLLSLVWQKLFFFRFRVRTKNTV